jgi:hypothetical protein
MPSSRITLQHLKPPTTTLIQPLDAVFAGTPQPREGNAPPPAILLDFMYGAAAYKCWGSGSEMKHAIHNNLVKEYQSFPQKQMDPSSGDSGSEPEPDDRNDGDYVGPGSSKRNCAHCPLEPSSPTDDDFIDPLQSNRAHSLGKPHYVDPLQSNRAHSPSEPHYVRPILSNRAWRPQDSLVDAMDNMNDLMMRVNGITPEMTMAEWQKEEEERQLKNIADNRSRVLEWMKESKDN